MSGPELSLVEQPFLDQLTAMGWDHTTGSLDDPGVTDRDSFRDVLLQTDLRDALHRINLDPEGRPWLDEGRITQAVSALQHRGTAKRLEASQAATELLLKGTVVDGVAGWDQGRGRTVHFIDWDHPENNRFRVINQFQVACPVGQADKHIHPDIVLFVNGIPLVIVECKSPQAATPLEEAVNQLAREKAFLVRAHGFLPTIQALELAPVISSEHNDTMDPSGEWSTRARIDARIARFKKPLFAAGPNTFDDERPDPLAFLIVKSMLLTGFDAPVEHILSLGMDPRIPPVEITDAEFEAHVGQERSPRAAASEMEHALRYHIREHLDEDPTHYAKLSERLKGILDALEGRWDELAEALKALIDEAREGRQQDQTTWLDPETQQPFFDLLKHEALGDGALTDAAREQLCALTVELVDHLQQEIALVGFWSRAQAQEGLRSWIFQTLDDADLIPFDRLDPVFDRLLELTRANLQRLVR
jgi:type I site-specific restriction-modification system R (restriction) subunit